eukprot:TRINITY_DN898_c2_g1_i6.p1 TRINITY_DN898_c2_g1~~TRINITY_DN898_c2_g1_i6.p1  ORF type:complete len:527 (-),score=71.41 TRINITY_DN898_c2_g1_i6:1010-2590(-)
MTVLSADKCRFDSDTAQSQGPFYGWAIAFLCMVSKLVKCQGQNNVMAFTVPHLLRDLRLTDGELGVLFSVGTILSSTVQPLFGRAVDQFGARLCVSTAHFTLALTLAGFSAARYQSMKFFVYVEVIVSFFFLRALSLGALEICPNACLQRWFVRRRGRAVSLVGTAQWIGISLLGLVVAWLVSQYSWRRAAMAGASLNMITAVVTALFLRSGPEDCGLLPDGDGRVLENVKDPDRAVDSERAGIELVEQEETTASQLLDEKVSAGLWQIYIFSFFFSVAYSASDFYMMEIIAENPGANDRIDIAGHIFAPLALVCGFFSPILGELVDRYRSVELTFFFIGVAGCFACIATVILCFASTPLAAITYSLLRGMSFAVFFAIISSGLAFAAMGIPSNVIGSYLGKNAFANIAGTGVGPLGFGLANDFMKSFDPSLLAASVPMGLIGISFVLRSYQMRRANGARTHEQLVDETPVHSADVIGKSNTVADLAVNSFAADPADSLQLLELGGIDSEQEGLKSRKSNRARRTL